MKRLILFAAILAAAFSIQAQGTVLSPRAALTLSDIRQGKCATEKISALVSVPDGTDRKAFDAYDVEVNTVTGKMMTVRIPIKQFEQLVASGLCTYIDVAQQVHPYLDRTRNNLGIDYIHQGLNLPQGYDGSGVVVGVIDRGFESLPHLDIDSIPSFPIDILLM